MGSAFPDGRPFEAVYAAPQLRARCSSRGGLVLGLVAGCTGSPTFGTRHCRRRKPAAELRQAARQGSVLSALAALASSLHMTGRNCLDPHLLVAGGAGSGLQQLAGTCAVSAKLIDDLRQRCLALAREVADAGLKRRRESLAAASASTLAAESGTSYLRVE